jgi:hypothetical protein
LKNKNYALLYRYSGYYSPILKNIEIFDSPSLTQSETNFKFDTQLTNFGIMKQRIVSKVNRNTNLLKFKDKPNLNSIYPMIDEYGYHTVDFFIFKSTWDLGYHFESENYEIPPDLSEINTQTINTKSDQFRNNNRNLL